MNDLQRHVVAVAPALDIHEADGAFVRRAVGTAPVPAVGPLHLLDEFFLRPDARVPPYVIGNGLVLVYVLDGRVRTGTEGPVGTGGAVWDAGAGGAVYADAVGAAGLAQGVRLGFRAATDGAPAREGRSERVPASGDKDAQVQVVAGVYQDVTGPAPSPAAVLDVTLAAGGRWAHRVPYADALALYGLRGDGTVGANRQALRPARLLALGAGRLVTVHAGALGARFLLFCGRDTVGTAP